MEKHKASVRYPPEVRARAVRTVQEHAGEHGSQWEAIGSIAVKIGCTGETLWKWVRQAERDQGLRPGPTSEERERIKALERENRELRQANEILRNQSELCGTEHACCCPQQKELAVRGQQRGGGKLGLPLPRNSKQLIRFAHDRSTIRSGATSPIRTIGTHGRRSVVSCRWWSVVVS